VPPVPAGKLDLGEAATTHLHFNLGKERERGMQLCRQMALALSDLRSIHREEQVGWAGDPCSPTEPRVGVFHLHLQVQKCVLVGAFCGYWIR
jgi:hypothetical protein